jgi:hypothetical protein
LCGSGDLSKRKLRRYESEIAYIGERYDVLSRTSRVPQKESYATPLDGFNEKLRTSSVDFAHPKSRKEFVAKPPEKPKMITTESVPEICHEERRPLPGNARGFGAILNRHEENHDQRCWKTSSGDSFGYGMGSTRKIFRRDPYATKHPSGVGTEHEENRSQGLQTGMLCGEEYRDRGEPSKDTGIQRSWLYTHDASLRNIHHGGSIKKPGKIDNELSLPLGEGAMKKVREDLKARQGKLFRCATHITKGRDKMPGFAIFKDDP